MKIAILGTKGIPNQYGGFEQFAEYLSKGLVVKGHEVVVYNPHFHNYTQDTFQGVKIKKIYSPEKTIGSVANYLYDFLCLKNALQCDYDIIYEAGYGSVAFFYSILPIKKSIIVTNMDGLEWKRAKWNGFIQSVTKFAEKIAVEKSHYLISDNVGIQQYYKEKFNRDSFYLPYGADVVNNFDVSFLSHYKLKAHTYYLLIARMEPENNIELMLNAFKNSGSEEEFIVIGNTTNAYGQRMRQKFESQKIRFLGGVYNKQHLDSLRHFSKAYLHGHSVGGTNPSLLEAMACHCFILAHHNPFNQSVLNENALYFSDEQQLTKQFTSLQTASSDQYADFKKQNAIKIRDQYNWTKIVDDHERLFTELLSTRVKASN